MTPHRVDSQHPLPRGERPEPRVGVAGHARVIADHVDRSEAIDRGSGQGIDRSLVADIGGHRKRLAAQARDLFCGGLQRGLLDVGQHHVEPSAGEPLGQGQADATAGPGDDGNFPRSQFHDPSPYQAWHHATPAGSPYHPPEFS